MKSLRIAALLAILATPAAAADLGSKDFITAPPMPVTQWTGAYLGASFGVSSSNGTLDISQGANYLTIDGLGADGIVGVLTAGYDFHLPASKLVLGAYGTYSLGSNTWELSSSTGFDLTADLTNRWSVGGKAGYLLTAGILTYAKFGYASADFDISSSVALPRVKSPTLRGWELGTGVEMSMGGGLFVNTEYVYTSYSDADIYNVGRVNASIGVDEHRFLTGFTYKLGQYTPISSYK
jgi:outer membrane immunogenic protein